MQVINSQADGPFASRTRFGWAIRYYGLMRQSATEQRATVHRIIAIEVEDQIVKLFNYDLSERLSEDKPEKSYEDVDVMEKSAELVEGHYELCLPLRNRSVKMPDNLPKQNYNWPS